MTIWSGKAATTLAAGRVQARQPLVLLLLGLFFLSGFSALAYQTVWQRMLGAFAGSDSVATAMIVGAFLFGLGIGSLAAASFADRLSLRGALQVFALCEIAVGAFACFSRTVFYDLFLGAFVGLAGDPLASGLMVFLALLPPTMLMGMSLPLLSRIVVDRIEGASSRIGWLYGLNTLGAAAGALVTGALLIGAFGFVVTAYAAAAGNFLVGTLAWLASGSLSPSLPASAWTDNAGVAGTRHRMLQWSVMVFVSGFLIIALEIVWFRVLGTLLHQKARAFCLILGVFLVGDGLGVVAGAQLAVRLGDARRTFQLLQGTLGLYALGSLGALFALTGYAGESQFGVEGLVPYRLAFTVIAVMPPAVLLGMSFPISQRAIQDDPAVIGRRVGVLQLCNILGNMAGAVVTGLVLLHWFGTAWTLRLIGLGSLAFVLCALSGRRNPPRDAALALALAILVAVFPNNAAFWSALHGAGIAEGAIVGEDRTGIAVLRPSGSRVQTSDNYGGSVELPHDTLFISGHPQSRVPFLTVHGALGAVGALLHPDPREMLIIGQGTAGTPIAAGVNRKTRRIRVVDIASPVLDVMRAAALRSGEDALHKPIRQYYADPRYTRIVADARHLLLTEDARYDIIEADAVVPTSALAGQLYSTDFFRLALRRLKPGGYVVQWMATDRTLASFLRVFPYVVRINSMLVGSAGPIEIGDQRLAKALAGPAGEYLTRMGWNLDELAPALTTGWVQSWTPHDPRGDDDINTDLFPKDEYNWSSR